jgi:hypothetical protein
MTPWLLAFGLIILSAPQERRGFSGQADIDFGRVIPGHYYYFKHFFKNETGVPIKLSSPSMRCGSCPPLMSLNSWLAPGDSTLLNFSRFVGGNLQDSMWANIYLYTDDGQRRGMWIYRLRFSAKGSNWVRPVSKPIKLKLNQAGWLEGSFGIYSQSPETLAVAGAGLPSGFRFSPPLPLRLAPGKTVRLTLTTQLEILAGHPSLTLDLSTKDRSESQRLSLPLVQ